MTGLSEGVERDAGATDTQRRLLAAPDQLLGLSVKFNFSNTAAADFDVVPGDGYFVMALLY